MCYWEIKKIRRLGAVLLVAFGLLVAPAVGGSALINIEIRKDAVSLKAEAAPLDLVLQALAQKTNVSIETRNLPEEKVTLEIEEKSLEECLRRILVRHNHLMFVKQGSGQSDRIELRFLAPKTGISGNDAVYNGKRGEISDLFDSPNTAENLGSKYQRESLFDIFKNSTALLDQISGQSIAGQEGPGSRGIRIHQVERGSVFHKLGIRKDEIIEDVNGAPVSTVEELLENIQRILKMPYPVIRIQRTRTDHTHAPIYIGLE